MSLIVTVLVLTWLGQCWSAPQRRNWTPQAIFYLTGAQGLRSVPQRTSREDAEAFQPAVTHDQSSDGLGLPSSSFLLELLQRAVEEGGGNPDSYPHEQELHLNYL